MPNCRPCVDPEMRNALAIQRNSDAIASLVKSFQGILVKFAGVEKIVKELEKRMEEFIIEKFAELFQKKLDAESAARVEGDTSLSERIDAVDESKASKEDLKTEAILRNDKDLELSAKTDIVKEMAVRLNTEEKEARTLADADLDRRVTALEGGSGSVEEQIAAEREARVRGDAELAGEISLLKTSLEDISGRVTTVSEELTAMQVRVNEIDSAVARKANASDLVELAGSVSTISTKVIGIESDLAEKTVAITSITGRLDGIDTRMDSIESKIPDFSQILADIETLKRTDEHLAARILHNYEAITARVNDLERKILEFTLKH